MLLGLVLLECCWGLYYWNVVGACTNEMLFRFVLMDVVGVCSNGMLLGLVLMECCWGLYY